MAIHLNSSNSYHPYEHCQTIRNFDIFDDRLRNEMKMHPKNIAQCNFAKVEKFEQWSTKMTFALSIVALTFNFFPAFQLPFLLSKNGGVAFFLPLLFFTLLVGCPLIGLDIFLGIAYPNGSIHIFKQIFRPLKGVGAMMVLTCIPVTIINNGILSWILKFLIETINGQPPWWSNENSTIFENWMDELFNPSNSQNIGISIDLVGPLMLISAITYGAVFHGPKSIQTYSYVGVNIPLIGFLTILLFSLTDNGLIGLKIFLKPDWLKLRSVSVWTDACIYVLKTLGCGMGIVSTYARYNKPKIFTSVEIAIISFMIPLLSLIFGIAVSLALFSEIGPIIGHQESILILEGNGLHNILVFYPIHISISNQPRIRLLVFFTAVLVLGFNTIVATTETIHSALSGVCKLNKRYRGVSRFMVVSMCFIVSLPTITTRGFRVIEIIDTFAITPNLLLIVVFQLAGIFIVLGLKLFTRDAELNLKRLVVTKTKGRLIVLWMISVMIGCVFLYVKSMIEIDKDSLKFDRNAVKYGWTLCACIVSPVILNIIFDVIFNYWLEIRKQRTPLTAPRFSILCTDV
ncbi:hypothetical protein ACOME3_005850 [Neoechinorhynchus agilis]